MTRTEHLLNNLMEEAAEVIVRASKAKRFGLAEVQPGQPLTNAQRLMGEVNDFVAVYQMLAGPLVSPTSPLFAGNPHEFQAAITEKQLKVEQFLAYSKHCGTLTPDSPEAIKVLLGKIRRLAQIGRLYDSEWNSKYYGEAEELEREIKTLERDLLIPEEDRL